MTYDRRSDHPDPGADPYGAPVAVTPAAPAQVPPGWYPDPHDPSMHRYWNGEQWTADQAPVYGSPGQQAPGQQAPFTQLSPVAMSPVVPTPMTETPRKRRSRGKIAAIVVGATVLLGGVITGAVLLLPGLQDAAESALNGGDSGRQLNAEIPADWTTMPVMGGAATVALDPSWEDVSAFVDAEALEAQMSQEANMDIIMHGAWLTDGDLWNGGTTISIMSIADAGGPSSARLEAQGFMVATRAELEGTITTSEGAVRTEGGQSGYVVEYESPIYDQTILGSVGIVVDGSRQLLVVTSGISDTGSGIEVMEAVVDSLSVG